jgi:KipI family sensor histidine kinase inhibitor
MIRLLGSGDGLLVVELGTTIDPATNRRALRLARRLARAHVNGVRDIVPAIASVGVHFDPLRTDRRQLEQAIRDSVGTLDADFEREESRTIEVPVSYGGVDGPDLEAVAAWSGCSPGEVVARHTGRTYRVYMLGFVPGFAYLGTVDPAIAAPRRATPRGLVPAGSVAIAGPQTGIYPVPTPGGWQIIGRTHLVLFDPVRVPAALLAPGDQVRFISVSGDTTAWEPDRSR